MAQISLEGDRNLDKEIRMGYDIHTRKFVIVNWQKLCAPLMEEGLDLFPVSRINGVVSFKFCWLFTFSDDLWARFLRMSLLQNVFKWGSIKKSSLWPAFKKNFQLVLENSGWVLGSGIGLARNLKGVE